MNKKKVQMGLIFGILYVAYAVVLFLLNKNFELSFWLSFGFITLGFVFMMISYFFVNNPERKKQVVGMPVTGMSTMYFVVEFVLGTIFMFFPKLGFTAAFIPQFILFVLFALCFVGAMLGSNNYKSINKTEQNTQENMQEVEQNDAQEN